MKRPRGNVEKTCITCGKPFKAPRAWDDRMKNCSFNCRQAARKAKREKKHLENMSKNVALAEKTRLTPAESAKIRGQISTFVRDQLTLANEVVVGTREWSPTQARVFSTLLNKVVPDLSASFVQHEVSSRDLIDLSREELEAIAAGIEIIDIEEEQDGN